MAQQGDGPGCLGERGEHFGELSGPVGGADAAAGRLLDREAVNSGADTGRTLLTVLILCAPGLAYAAVCRYRRDQAAAAQPDQEYRRTLAAWQQRAAAHEQAQLAGLGQVDEWGSAEPPGLRTDVFGGSWWGWQALLTTHGTSILAAQPLLVLDLSGQLVSGELTATAERYAGGSAAQYVLPADLGRCGLPIRETLMLQTGPTEPKRHSYLQEAWTEARGILIHTWRPAWEETPAL